MSARRLLPRTRADHVFRISQDIMDVHASCVQGGAPKDRSAPGRKGLSLNVST